MNKSLVNTLAKEADLVFDLRLKAFANAVVQAGFDHAQTLAVKQLKDTAADYEEMAARLSRQRARTEMERREQARLESCHKLLNGQSEHVARLVNGRTY